MENVIIIINRLLENSCFMGLYSAPIAVSPKVDFMRLRRNQLAFLTVLPGPSQATGAASILSIAESVISTHTFELTVGAIFSLRTT